MQNKLFETEPIEKDKPVDKCKNCIHSFGISYGSRNIWYCNKRKSNKTHNGKLKIKINDPSCDLFEKSYDLSKFAGTYTIDEAKKVIKEIGKIIKKG